jgi:NADPH:quinone reductase
MQAATVAAFGDIDVLNFGEVPTPSPKAGHVLIKVEAVGTNYYDTLVRSGAVSRSIPLPHVVGSDVVGHIEKLGDGVKALTLGDRVIVAPGFPFDPAEWDVRPENEAASYFPTGTYGWGGYAQYMEVPARWVVRDETDLAAEEPPCRWCSSRQCMRSRPSVASVQEAVCWSRPAPLEAVAWQSKSPRPLALT